MLLSRDREKGKAVTGFESRTVTAHEVSNNIMNGGSAPFKMIVDTVNYDYYCKNIYTGIMRNFSNPATDPNSPFDYDLLATEIVENNQDFDYPEIRDILNSDDSLTTLKLNTKSSENRK